MVDAGRPSGDGGSVLLSTDGAAGCGDARGVRESATAGAGRGPAVERAGCCCASGPTTVSPGQWRMAGTRIARDIHDRSAAPRARHDVADCAD